MLLRRAITPNSMSRRAKRATVRGSSSLCGSAKNQTDAYGGPRGEPRYGYRSATKANERRAWWGLTFDMSGGRKGTRSGLWDVRSMEGLGHSRWLLRAVREKGTSTSLRRSETLEQ